jgi:hypothetical protein
MRETVRISFSDFEEVVFVVTVPSSYKDSFNADLVNLGRFICRDNFLASTRESFVFSVIDFFNDKGYTAVSV